MLTPNQGRLKSATKYCLSVIFSSAAFLILRSSTAYASDHPIVLETDFGLQDGAVSSMKGVIYQVDPNLGIFDLTHEIDPQNIWEGAYRLVQTARYWPAGTVFVIVVDPGVGTERKSLVAKTKTGQYFVTPDNGTLTLIAETAGIDQVRVIDEKINRLPGSERSYTFHGRDVYAYTGARLAAGKINFSGVGPLLKGDIVKLPLHAATLQGKNIVGSIPVLDIRYGNVWTNIPGKLLDAHRFTLGKKYRVKISHNNKLIFDNELPYLNTFGGVRVGGELLYINSLDNLSLAINQGNFARRYHIVPDQNWHIEIELPEQH
jgi:S-adenosylmethionine hydrolase